MDVRDIRELLSEYEIKFIRLAFCDISGIQKNIAIMADEFEHAVTHGVSFDASAIKGFLNVNESDLLLFPDLDTFSILPWRPSDRAVARFYCYITYPDRRPFEGDGRYLLSEIEKRSGQAGYSFLVGPECEFYLFETDDKGFPTLTPFDEAGYFDMAPLDRGENVRREICFTLENMGLKPERSHHEHGPGQNEIDFRCSSPLKAADDLMTFKTAVKAIAQQHGLFASFLPKPLENESGNGLSLYEDAENLFENEDPKAMSFMSGILRRMKEITPFANPLVSSYERLGQFEAPSTVSWSHQNRSTLVRIPLYEYRMQRAMTVAWKSEALILLQIHTSLFPFFCLQVLRVSQTNLDQNWKQQAICFLHRFRKGCRLAFPRRLEKPVEAASSAV